MSKIRYPRSFGLLFSNILLSSVLCSCSVPNSKLASVSINARLLDVNGKPIPNKKLEITLPASYGMQELDLELAEPEEVGKMEQSTIVQTDLTGNFSYTFEKVTYNTAYWFLPPFGNFPKEPPKPSFVIKIFEKQKHDDSVVYSVGWNDKDNLNYAVMRSHRSKIPPYYLTGKVIRNERGEVPACIADFKFQKSN